MANFLSKIFEKSSDSVLGIDIGSSAIKIVQIKRKGEYAALETYGALALGPYNNIEVGRATRLPIEKVIEALKDILREAKTTTKKCAVAIPFNSSLMSLAQLPAVSPKELAKMVPLEARKYIPVPISEVSLDWSIIPRSEFVEPSAQASKPGTVDVLIVAINNDVLANYQDIVQSTGLSAKFFEIEIFSTMRSVVDQTIAPVMIMDIGAATTKVYIVERGVIRMSQTINHGSQDITLNLSRSLGVTVSRAEEMKRKLDLSDPNLDPEIRNIVMLVLDSIFNETSRVVLNYQKKSAKTISKIVLVGGGSAIKGLSQEVHKSFSTETVAGNPFTKVQAPAFFAEALKQTGPEFAVALGAALRYLQES